MKEPLIFRRDDCLRPSEAPYWKDLLYRTVKVGVELEAAMPKGVRKDDYLPTLVTALKPSRSLDELGEYGVLDVVTEHCGIEIQIIGQQPAYRALLDQFRSIVGPLVRDGARARSTCGLHFHLLAPDLRHNMPEIILANIWNLTRRYAPGLRFLTSTGSDRNALCRRRNYASHLELVRHTPGVQSMREIQQKLRESAAVPEHQNFLNLEHVAFANDGAIRELHLEFRFCDADLSVTSIVSKVFLFLALALKAVDLSQFGVIHVGRVREWSHKKQLLDLLSNNDGNHATSDTSGIDDEAIEELRADARELLELLKPPLVRLALADGGVGEDHPAFEVLSFLAENPISLLRSRGLGWEEIEELLSGKANLPRDELTGPERRLMRIIELLELTRLHDRQSWLTEAATLTGLSPASVEQCLEHLSQLRDLGWDPHLGAMVFRS